MKLSLTAIAVFFAAILHPTGATGTRAASSTSNTEDMPDRDLLVDFEDVAELVGGAVRKEHDAADAIIDEIIDSSAEALAKRLDTKLALRGIMVHQLARCLPEMCRPELAGDGGLSVVALRSMMVRSMSPTVDMGLILAELDEDKNSWIPSSELERGLQLLTFEELTMITQAFSPICATLTRVPPDW